MAGLVRFCASILACSCCSYTLQSILLVTAKAAGALSTARASSAHFFELGKRRALSFMSEPYRLARPATIPPRPIAGYLCGVTDGEDYAQRGETAVACDNAGSSGGRLRLPVIRRILPHG